jgi:oligosaccharide repeat unit polymerase
VIQRETVVPGSLRSASFWAVALIGTLALGFLISLMPADSARASKLIPFVIILCTNGSILIVERRARRISFFSPLVFSLGIYAVMFGIVPIADLSFGHPMTFHSDWTPAAWLAALGLALVYVGYRLVLTLHRPSRAVPRTWLPGTARVIGILLVMAAVGAVFLQLRSAGGIANYLSRFAERRHLISNPVPTLIAVSMAVPGFLLMAGTWVRRPTVARTVTLLFGWLPLVLMASAFLGQRWRALTIVVALLAIWHLGRRAIPAGLIACAMLALVLGFVVVNLQRNVVGTNKSARSISGRDFYDNYVATHEVGQFRDFVVTLEGVPARIDYQSGATFLSVIPGAPYPAGGAVFTSTFYPDAFARGVSYPNTLPGELYLNFGLLGVIVGMTAYGCALGIVQLYFVRNRERTGPLLVYAYSIIPLAGLLRGDFTTFAGYYLLGLIVLMAVLWLVERPTTAQSAGSRSSWIDRDTAPALSQ